MSALAMWNLGWMYENGIGVPQASAKIIGLINVDTNRIDF
jgi:hypothetical protein